MLIRFFNISQRIDNKCKICYNFDNNRFRGDTLMRSSIKLIACILAILMVFTLVSCSNQAETTKKSKTTLITTATSATTAGNQNSQTPAPAPQKDIKNLILIIGDGMGPQHIEAGQLSEGKTYDFTTWIDSVCNTNSINSDNAEVLTDSAASATALATGTLTKNGYVGLNKDGTELSTILDIAKIIYDKSVGVVTTDYLYGATPSGFSAHANDRNDSATITLSQISSDVDYLCGLRSDSHYAPYIEQIEENEIYYSTSLSDKKAILDSDSVFLPINIEDGTNDSVDLKDAATLAIEYLERDEDGFVLMIEQAYIDKCSHNNDIDGMLKRMKSLNETVEAVMDWVGDRDDTAVIVTADHETGGLSVSKNAIYDKSHNAQGNNVYYSWSSVDHTQTKVRIFVYGVDVDFATVSQYRIPTVIKNTDVFVLMKKILNFG